MSISLLNALPLGIIECAITATPISMEYAKQLLGPEVQWFNSYVGHQSTANILSEKMGIKIPFNRDEFCFLLAINGVLKFQPAIVATFKMPRRLNEGEVLTEEELLNMEVKFLLITEAGFDLQGFDSNGYDRNGYDGCDRNENGGKRKVQIDSSRRSDCGF